MPELPRGSLGMGILFPGIVQNEGTFNPHPLLPTVSLQVGSASPVPHIKHDIAPPLLVSDGSPGGRGHPAIKPPVHREPTVLSSLPLIARTNPILHRTLLTVSKAYHSLRAPSFDRRSPCVTAPSLINHTVCNQEGEACQQLIATQIAVPRGARGLIAAPH